jgi:4-diphosphocytidyl-2-C-methyl-D-erythritol kinase
MSLRSARLLSPAKINLALRVLHRRPDGFHELRTIFQTISLADTIEIDHTPDRRYSLSLESDPDIPDNLLVRAANLLHEQASISGAWTIRLHKRIPMGGGLGGGSSNAAAALLAIPVLAGKRIPLEALIELASKLGSDVPFFLTGGTAVGLGRGTEVYPLDGVLPTHGILAAPGIHVSTAEAYRSLNREAAGELTTTPLSSILNSFQSLAWRADGCARLPGWLAVNDFERPVFQQHPKLRTIRNRLKKAGAFPALMSGSGSSVFGLFADKARRQGALAELQKSLGQEMVFPISLLSRSGYRSLWRRQLRAHTEGAAWPPQSRYSS